MGAGSTFGRYRLLEHIGQGGMAEVFKAKSYGVEGFEKVVVIKRILPELAKIPEFVEMFIHEAKLAVRLSHANIVQVFDLGIAPGAVVAGAAQPDAYYMAMEYVSGLDLASLLTRCRRVQAPVPVEMAVYVAAEVAKGLDHAHRRRDEQGQPLNIVHLDVSPQNVLVSLEGEVKVTDFGIAKARGALEPSGLEDTRQRQLQGKFGYMSPEHAEGEAVDARSDLFSLGTVLYELLTGVNPFSAPTTFETLRRVQACEYPPVELLRPDAPRELIAIVRQAMAKDPAERFNDAGRMYEALLSFLYAQGRRFSAHDLADFLQRFRETADETGPYAAPVLDGEPTSSAFERTPVEVPTSRRSYSSISTMEAVVDVERAGGMGERREVSALVIELPERDGTTSARAAEVVTRYGGRIQDQTPEQITAIFGLNDPDGRDTEVATRCALVVLRSLAGPKLGSAGLHTGRIHVSADGSPTEDDRLTSLVNDARTLARTREGMCAISAPAMRQVRDLFVFDATGEPNRRTPMASAFVVRDIRPAAEAYGKFVGRKEELRFFGEALATITKRVACVVTLRGDHGIGKTRLLVEVDRRLRKGGYNLGWYSATCPPRGPELPLSGIEVMLRKLCGVAEGDPEARVQLVAPRLRALGLQEDEVAAMLALLGAGTAAGGGNLKAALSSGFARMTRRLCDDRPHAFAWDAAHALDRESIGVIQYALARMPQARAVFVLAVRAGFSHPLEAHATHVSLDLADLRPEDVETLVAARLGVTRAPPELLRFLRDRAGGHPQMIEELVKALVEARAVTVAEGAVVSMKLVGQELSLPKTLRGLVASRVSRLSAANRGVLQAASILAPGVNSAVLAEMTGMDLGTLERSLGELKAQGFLVHTNAVELRFASPLVREVVLDALPLEAAREMHVAAARALETVLRDKVADVAGDLATHLYEGGEREAAAGWFAKSAERRLAVGQLEAAAKDYGRAIELCDVVTRSPRELADWLAGLARAVRLVRSAPEAPETCERVIARVDEDPDLELRVRARIDAGRILGAVHSYEAARAQFSAAKLIAQGKPDLVKTALVAAAEFSGRQGDFKRSLELLERLQSVVTDDGDGTEEHKLVVALAQTSAAAGDRAAALKWVARADTLLPDEPTAAAERHKLRALIDYFARDWRGAALHSERAIEMARDLDLPYEVAVNLHNLGDTLVRLADYARAYGALKQSVALCDEYGYERLASHNRMFLAYLDGLNGDPEATSQLLQGIRYAEANDFTWDVLGGRMLLAQLLERRGDRDAARLEYQKLRDQARAAGNTLVFEDCDASLRAMPSAPPSPTPPEGGG